MAFNRLQCTKENRSKERINILCNYRLSLSASLFSCASPFPLRSLVLLQVAAVLGFRGHASTRYSSPPPICRSCSAGHSLNSHLASDSIRNSRRQKLVQLAAYSSPEPPFFLVRRGSQTRSAALPDVLRHSLPRSSSRRRQPWPSSIQGAFRRPDCPGSSSLARWFGTPPLVQARVLTCASSRRLLFFSFSICHVASLVCLFPLKCLFVRERMVGLLPASCKCPIPSSKLADLCGAFS